jgi:hypothetical protein
MRLTLHSLLTLSSKERKWRLSFVIRKLTHVLVKISKKLSQIVNFLRILFANLLYLDPAIVDYWKWPALFLLDQARYLT